MANFEIDEDQAALIRELRKLETSDPVHANVYNALFEKLINNDAFLERLANKMIEKSMLCHVLDSVNAQQVLAADVGPKITAITNELKENVSVLNTNFNNKQNREWIYAATLSNKNTASVGVNIRNYREACIIINGHRKSGSIMIVDDVLHFIAPEAGTGTMAFMYLVKVNIVNGGFGLYVEAANRICFLESNAWLENRNWSNSFNLYIR